MYKNKTVWSRVNKITWSNKTQFEKERWRLRLSTLLMRSHIMSLNMRRYFSIKSHLKCVLVITRNVAALGLSLLNWIELDPGEVPIPRIFKASRNKGGMPSVDWGGLVSKKKRRGWQWEEDVRKPGEVPSPSRGDLGRVRRKEVCHQWT